MASTTKQESSPDANTRCQHQEQQKQPPTEQEEEGVRGRLNRLSERFSNLLPHKFKCYNESPPPPPPPLTKDNADVESEVKSEPNITTKWIVIVTVAGLIVSAVVLIIVLVSLLSSSSSPSVTGHHNDIASLQTHWELPNTKGFHQYVADSIAGAMDNQAKPCEDFYQYACGRWAIHNPPPKGVSRWSNFEEMTVTIWDLMQEQLEKIATLSQGVLNNNRRGKGGRHMISSRSDSPSPPKDTTPSLLMDADPFVVDLVGVYYTTCENETKLDASGVKPLKELVQQMDEKYNSKLQLQPLQIFQEMLEYVHHELTIHAFFSWKVETDNSIANTMVIELTTPSLDLLPQGTIVRGNEELIKTYTKYAKTLLEMVGTYRNSDPEKEANIIVELLEVYQPLSGSALVNATNITELNALAPFLNWQQYFNHGFNEVGAFITQDERILSMIQEYLGILSEKVISEMSKNGSQRLYKYLRWQVIQYYSQFLHRKARNAILPLFDGISGENTTLLPKFRYRPCIKELEDRLALPMGYLLLETIKKQLSENSNIQDIIRSIENMAHNIRESYKIYITSFTWLSDSAKNMLLNKLSFIKILVGYPHILDDIPSLQSLYETLIFKEGQLLQNQINLLKFNQLRKMKFLRAPLTYTEWEVLSPMSLISFYVYRRNTLLIPLGGFMHPLYTTDLPEVLSYATMGLFISHEIGHAIDFVGRTRDQFGRTNATMWDEKTVSDFVQRVLCRVTEYSERYYPVEGLLTIAEVMADDGSIGTAYQTVRDTLGQSVFPESLQDLMSSQDLSPDQLFFLYYAQLFCSATPPGVPLKGIDHYPPHSVRVQATLGNTAAFHQAFNCPIGSYMNPIRNQTCDIW